MASEVKRYDISDFGGDMVESEDGAWYHMDDHDRVVAELRSHVHTDNSAVIAGLQEQMAEARELLFRCVSSVRHGDDFDLPPHLMNSIDAWLEKTK